MSIVGHLAELRVRLIIVLLSFVAAAIVGWYGHTWIIRLFQQDVGRIVFFTPAEMFFTKLRIAATLGMLITLPTLLAQAWLFVMPGLYPEEQGVVRRFIPIACGLFVVGLLFGYAVVYPAAVHFLLGMSRDSLQPAVSISDHFSFFVGIILPFGLLFQVPLVMLLLAQLGLVNPLLLYRRRRHVIFWSFALAAFITPPDVVSQVILAVPMILLFELGIILARRAIVNREA